MKILGCSLAVIVTLAARAAFAQAPALEVQVIGERADALQGVPGSGTVIGSEELRRADPADAAEILRRVPGLVVRQDENAGMRLDVGVRGLDATRGRRVLVLEDGVPLAVNPYAEPDLYFGPALERARAIEVVKGSGSILFGPQTIGGVINILTLPLPEAREAKLDVTGGERGYARWLARYGDAFGSARFVVQAFHKQGDGTRGERFRADDVLAKIAIDTFARGELTLKLSFHDERARSAEVGLTTPMFEADPFRPTFTPDNALSARRLEIALLHEQRFTDDLALRTLAYAYTTSRLWRRQDYDRSPVPGVAYTRIVGDPSVPGGAIYFRESTSIPDRTFDVAGIEPRFSARFAAGPTRHAIDAGLRLLVERGHREERAGSIPTSDAGDLLLDETHTSVAFAAYVQDRVRLLDDLSLVPGLRFEHVAYARRLDRVVVAGAPRDVAIGGDSGATALIPGIGVTAGPAKMHAFAGVHLGFAPPRVDTAIAATGQDQHLLPERSVNVEIGARAAPRRFVQASATAFFTSFDNQVLPTGGGGKDQPGLFDAGRTRHAGLEASALLRPGLALGLGTAIDLSLRYTLARATFAAGPFAGHVLPYAPLHTASATLDVEHPIGVGAELSWSFVSEQFADPANTVAADVSGRAGRLAPYHLLDAGLRYREPRTRLTLRVTAKNLLDAAYIASRRPDGIFVGAPRLVMAGLSWDYR